MNHRIYIVYYTNMLFSTTKCQSCDWYQLVGWQRTDSTAYSSYCTPERVFHLFTCAMKNTLVGWVI